MEYSLLWFPNHLIFRLLQHRFRVVYSEETLLFISYVLGETQTGETFTDQLCARAWSLNPEIIGGDNV